jgi:hypothetical protein
VAYQRVRLIPSKIGATDFGNSTPVVGSNFGRIIVRPSMPERSTAEVDQAIVAEVRAALQRLGASEMLVYRAATMLPCAIYEEMERLGADPYLLAFIGSWRDTLTDEEVLDHLRDWNAGTFKLERLASTGDVDRIRAELTARKRRLS